MEIDVNTQAVIATGTALSAQADIGNKTLVGLIIPAAWIAAAGGITLQGSVDGGVTWYEITTVGGAAYAIAFTGIGPAYIAIDPSTLRGISSFKVRSGTVGAPVNQTSTLTVELVARMVI
jgi:hypothetical protein